MTGSGFADLHNHQFAHLAFGGVEFFGEPSGPIPQAVPWCTPAHGPGGIGDVIGTVIKWAYNYPGAGLGHHVGGYPEFDGWPRWDSVTHQTVHIDWLERAWQGGLRLMVMLAVNSEFMCNLPGMARAPGRTCADMEAVDLQLDAAKALEAAIDQASGGPGNGWYRIVTSAQEAAAAIAAGKLAVVLGIEVDYLFGSYLSAALSADQVRAAVQEYYDKGVRYVFPIHFADNAFGGTGLQNALQAADAPVDLNAPIAGLVSPYVLKTQDGHSLGYEHDGGKRNTRGLTDLGRVLLQELMAHGMIFDVDHMSYNTRSAALDLAEAANYPVVSGHSGFIDVCLGDKRHEGQQTAGEVERIRSLGGMVSPIIAQGTIDTIVTWPRPDGTSIPHVCGGSINSYAQAYLYAVEKMQGGAVGVGTDFNGFAGVPGPTSGPDACPGGVGDPSVHLSGLSYPFKSASGLEMDRSQIGDKTFDINTDGLAHVGMLPDFVACLSALGVTNAELEPLLNSAESFVGLWTKAQPSPQANPCALATGIGNAGNLQVVTLGTDHAPYLIWQDHGTGAWHWGGPLPAAAGVGITAVATGVGNGGNLQVVALGTDGAPYLIWQDKGTGNWSWYGALPHQAGVTFTALTAAVGNGGNLQVVALGTDGAPYLIWQDHGNGSWHWYGALPHQAGTGFFSVVATAEVGGNLQVVCLGTADHAPYLIWQDQGNGSWHWYGAMPHPQGLGFRQAATGVGNGGNLQVVCVGASDGQLYLIWQDARSGSWFWGGTLPIQPGLNVATLATGVGNGGNLQVVCAAAESLYLLWQDRPSGRWSWYGQLPDGVPGVALFPVVTGIGNGPNLQVIAAGGDGVNYLVWQDGPTGRWNWYGQLPAS